MATFNVGDQVIYKNLAGRHGGVGVITDLIGTTAKIHYDKDKEEAMTKSSFYTFTDVKYLKHYKKGEKNNGICI